MLFSEIAFYFEVYNIFVDLWICFTFIVFKDRSIEIRRMSLKLIFGHAEQYLYVWYENRQHNLEIVFD